MLDAHQSLNLCNMIQLTKYLYVKKIIIYQEASVEKHSRTKNGQNNWNNSYVYQVPIRLKKTVSSQDQILDIQNYSKISYVLMNFMI